MSQYRRLNSAEFRSVVQRSSLLPGSAEIAAAFHVDSPSVVLGATSGQDGTVGQLNGFVFDRTEDSVWKAARLRPALAAICGSDQHSPPLAWAWPDFVKEHQRPARGLKQDWVPAGIAFTTLLNAVGDFDDFGPAVLV